VVESLLCKCEALSSNSSPTKKEGRKEEKKEGREKYHKLGGSNNKPLFL
jgi:hypothetical protein